MTEIQWLVHIMMEHKLPEPVKQKFIARIGEVESSIGQVRPRPQPIHSPRNLEEALADVPQQMAAPKRIPVPQEVTVQSNGTTSIKGPRKF